MGGERIFQAEDTKALCKGPGLGRNLILSRNVREIVWQETRGRVAPVRPEK